MTDKLTLHHGDCLEVLRSLPDCSVDSVVTDPPYGLSFMGKRWDYDVPSVEVWAECLRVLKPGGHLLAFAGTRTQHRMAVRIEDAGFEIRDMIAWVYGSGFPKSLDVSKAIDKAAGAEREVIRTQMTAHSTAGKGLSNELDERPWMTKARELGYHEHAGNIPATPEAKQWEGWGTALKPALEPITVARKPLIGTVAENVLQHGTGAINVDACRVGTEDKIDFERKENGITQSGWKDVNRNPYEQHSQGRWPANFIHDGSEEVVGLFPQAGGGFGKRGGRNGATVGDYGMGATMETVGYGDSGSAARFFYCAKASKADRGENHHPTVKPTDLMRYLCRLVTPPSGIVLDPFMGSGSTGKAAMLEGFAFVGIEREAEYIDIAKARIQSAVGLL
jgi:site-specific DNA-methyltransferase (adenine-specific)